MNFDLESVLSDLIHYLALNSLSSSSSRLDTYVFIRLRTPHKSLVTCFKKLFTSSLNPLIHIGLHVIGLYQNNLLGRISIPALSPGVELTSLIDLPITKHKT